MRLVATLVVVSLFMVSPVMATTPGKIVFLSTKTDIKGCYFKKGEEQQAKSKFRTTFSFGEEVCMRAYATGKIGNEINMQDFIDGKFYKGYVFSWKYPNGDSGFWLVKGALAELKPLPRGRHCVKMFVTGPDENGVRPKHRRLAAQGCFNVQ